MDRHTEFYKAIKDIIPESPFTLIDYCCGDGALGALFDNHPLVQRIVFVDVKNVRDLQRKTSTLNTPFEVFLEGIEAHNPRANSFILSLHSCGTLTDRVIEIAVQTRNPFAVMPCCYRNRMSSLKPSSNHSLPVSYSRKDYYDALRMEYAKERGYRTEMRAIDRRITPMNQVIIGAPLD